MKIKHTFTEYTKRIPFLKEIPKKIACQLSVEEFYFPDREINNARQKLEGLFDQHVMSYKADIFIKDIPLEYHLCANYKGAKLTKKQLAVLRVYEMKLRERNVRFVAYQKPLVKISIQESPFFN